MATEPADVGAGGFGGAECVSEVVMHRWLLAGVLGFWGSVAMASDPGAEAEGPDGVGAASVLATEGAAERLREAAAKVEAGDAEGARAILDALLADGVDSCGAVRAASAMCAAKQALERGDRGGAVRSVDEAMARAFQVDDLAELFEDDAPDPGLGQPFGSFDGVNWMLGSAPDINEGLAVVVFWELWCPHCRKHLPELAAQARSLKGEVSFVGLTGLSRGVEVADATRFAKQSKVRFPMGHDTGEVARRHAVQGIPHVIVVQDGEVAWKGHPAELSAVLDALRGS